MRGTGRVLLGTVALLAESAPLGQAQVNGGGCSDDDMSSRGEVQLEDRAISTSVDLIGADLVQGFTTYQVKIHLEPTSENCYTLYGDVASQLSVPPAYQCATPFGADVGGTNPAFWPIASNPSVGYSQYDSWLTLGLTDGDESAALSSIGLDFSVWNENNALVSDSDSGGAVFWMDPDAATDTVPDSRTVVIAQLTLRSGQDSARMNFNAQGRTAGRDHTTKPTGTLRDWDETCIFVLVGGSQNGQGNHVYNPVAAPPTPTPAGPPPSPPPPRVPSPPPLSPSAPPPPGITPSLTPWLSLYIPSPPECPLSDVRTRIAELDAVCCAEGACDERVNNGAPTSCSPLCGGKMLALYSICNQTLDILFDGQDGSYDGVASTFSDLRQTCLQLSPSSVVDEMKRLEDSGCELNTNGIGEEAVQHHGADGCTDSGPVELCGLIIDGALTCQDDFCQDKKACAHSGACDATCLFCRRRSQISFGDQCSALTLQSRVEPINGACCDEDGACNGGGAGVPTVCDAKCAIVYRPFFSDCQTTLQMAFGAQPDTYAAFSQLASTCDALPVDQLLQATAGAICPNSILAAQPESGGFGNWLDDALDCPLGMLERHAINIDNQCCANDPDHCFWPEGGSPAECSLDCGTAMLGSATQCTKTMDVVLDAMDGDRDGKSHVVDDLHQKCMAIPPRAVILHLKELQDQGCLVDVNGVSETTVGVDGDGICVDTADSALCSLVTSGLLSCSVDFCPGACPHASACDATCGFCQGGDGGDGHSNTGVGRRSLQINIDDSPCDVSEFQARTDRVNVQCCDNNQCGNGVPTTCDAKCAMEYLSYYSECSQQIAISFPAADQYKFASLQQTCLSLPLQPLMTVAATIDCDAHEPGGPAGGSTETSPPPAPSPDIHEDTSRCSDLTFATHASSVDYSTRPRTVMGTRSYTAGTIAVIECSSGYSLTRNGNNVGHMGMACKHGSWSDETGALLTCQPGH